MAAPGYVVAVQAVALALLLAYAACLFVRPIHLTEADLGRHIKNGELFVETLAPLATNFYSYTEPDRPAPNHHWGAGLVFYAGWRWLGFSGLELAYVLLHVGLVALLFRVTLREAGFWPAWVVTAVGLPLLAFRPEIRPEGLSYAFFALFYVLLWGKPGEAAEGRGRLAAIPVLQVLWTNVHIFFCFGPLLVVAAALEAAQRGQRDRARTLGLVAVATAAACLVNPFGLTGALQPFTIFEEYGYPVAENQSVLELQRFYDLPVLAHFQALSVAALAIAAGALRDRAVRREFWIRAGLLLGFGALAWMVARGVALFALLCIPILSALASRWMDGRIRLRPGPVATVAPVTGLALLVAAAAYPGTYASPFARAWGLGLEPGVERSASFFAENGIQGPVFNDYDIGGYLIFTLFPKERVFVDNRPEAYSVDFFRNTYIPMQREEPVWQAMDARHHFNAIFFSRRDRAPWARPFLVRRLRDPSWAPVFADPYALILVRRTPENEALIQRFAPKGKR